MDAQIYKENNRVKSPDKIVDYKMKNDGIFLTHKFLVCKIDKNKSNVVGYVKEEIVTKEELDNQSAYLSSEKWDGCYYSRISHDKGFFRRNVGYVSVGKDKYVGLTRSWVPLFLIFLSVSICILFVIIKITSGSLANKSEDVFVEMSVLSGKSSYSDYEEDAEWNGILPQNGKIPEGNVESTTFPGYANLYFSKKNSNLQLINPKENTVDFEYYIKLDGEVICSTKKIKPGNMKEVDLTQILNQGTHTLIFSIVTYDVESKVACNEVDQVVNVTIK